MVKRWRLRTGRGWRQMRKFRKILWLKIIPNWRYLLEKMFNNWWWIYKSLYKSPNWSLQIIRPITIDNKNSQKDHYAICYELWFWLFKNYVAVREVGGLKIRTTCGQGGRGDGQKFVDVLTLLVLWMAPYSCNRPTLGCWNEERTNNLTF